MNNKIDNVMVTLLKAKEDITNNVNIKNSNKSSYDEVIKNLDNIIVNYTIKNKMTNKEILDCAMSLYEHKEQNKFIEKIKNLSPKKFIQKTKNKIIENYKKKEIKKKYEEEIVLLVKNKLKSMIDEDRKNANIPEKNQEEKQIDMQKNNVKSVPIFDKDIVKIIDVKKIGTFIFQDDDNYFVYKETDNINNSNIEKSALVKFSSLDQAIIYSIDDNVSVKDIRNDFNKFKNKYDNLDDYIVDKRYSKNLYNNIDSIDNNMKMNSEIKQQKI